MFNLLVQVPPLILLSPVALFIYSPCTNSSLFNSASWKRKQTFCSDSYCRSQVEGYDISFTCCVSFFQFCVLPLTKKLFQGPEWAGMKKTMCWLRVLSNFSISYPFPRSHWSSGTKPFPTRSLFLQIFGKPSPRFVLHLLYWKFLCWISLLFLFAQLFSIGRGKETLTKYFIALRLG